MKRRTFVLAAALVLVVALATPGLGESGGRDVPELAEIAKKALKKTKKRAKRADKASKRANARLDAQQVVSATANGVVTTTSPIGTYVDLGGPSVTLTVPDSGLIEVWAQVEMRDDDGGAVALFQDGSLFSGTSSADYCGDDEVLIESTGNGVGNFVAFSTPPTPDVIVGCANVGAPAPVLLQTTPGQHTFQLRYSECVCGGGAEFRNRLLRVAARP